MVKIEAPTSPVYERAGNYFFLIDFDDYDEKYCMTIRINADVENNRRGREVSKNDLENLRDMLNKVLGFEKIKLN